MFGKKKKKNIENINNHNYIPNYNSGMVNNGMNQYRPNPQFPPRKFDDSVRNTDSNAELNSPRNPNVEPNNNYVNNSYRGNEYYNNQPYQNTGNQYVPPHTNNNQVNPNYPNRREYQNEKLPPNDFYPGGYDSNREVRSSNSESNEYADNRHRFDAEGKNNQEKERENSLFRQKQNIASDSDLIAKREKVLLAKQKRKKILVVGYKVLLVIIFLALIAYIVAIVLHAMSLI